MNENDRSWNQIIIGSNYKYPKKTFDPIDPIKDSDPLTKPKHNPNPIWTQPKERGPIGWMAQIVQNGVV